MGHKIQPVVKNIHECKDCQILKGWGEELIIENNDLYCAKLLNFKEGAKFSMHYHLIKDETWYVQEGEFVYKWINTNNAELQEKTLKKGDVVRQLAGQPHQLIALTNGVIFEVSTTHYDYDSYRIFSGDNQISKICDIKPDSDRGHVYYTLNNTTIDLRQFDYTLPQSDVEQKFGWEACMYWSNIYYKELDNQFFKIEEGDVFVDLGANIGMSATYAELKNASKIYALEPDPYIYECLIKNKGNNWVCVNAGVSDHDGVFEMGYWPDTNNKFIAECITLDSFINLYNIEHIDYLKIDIEGSEYDVIKSVSQDTWDKINKIFIEYHEDVYNFNNDTRDTFIKIINNAGFINFHIVLGVTQSFMYFWK